jgi:hypothetical protein
MHTWEKHFMIILNIQNTQEAFESIQAIDRHFKTSIQSQDKKSVMQ